MGIRAKMVFRTPSLQQYGARNATGRSKFKFSIINQAANSTAARCASIYKRVFML